MTEMPKLDFKKMTAKAVTGAARLVLVSGTKPGKEAEAFLKRVAKPIKDAKEGEVLRFAYAAELKAEEVFVVKLKATAKPEDARKAGADVAKVLGAKNAVIALDGVKEAGEFVFGLALRAYRFDQYKADAKSAPTFTILHSKPASLENGDHTALAEGVYFARDLVNEPANILTTENYAERLAEMSKLGLEVEVLDETAMEKLGMRALLAVGQGSASPSKLVVMRWNGGGKAKPLALVGKGVVFDTGGISIKPAAGMEAMVGDMGGSATVAGTMRALALRKAKANVVGVVGIVENMPDGKAQRPGDIVKSMKGDTIEVINTDAEGRLVLADALWYVQEKHDPAAIIDLATLTGAMLVALGHEYAGIFSNDDKFANQFLKSADRAGEQAWQLPIGPAYDKLIDCPKADMKNVGGRYAGSITAAQFLHRFIKPKMPWIHIDIAGVSDTPSDTDLAPKGATGWGIRALDQLVRDQYEGK
ncbi:leucyl aminopeptidase [Paracoccaceae bacterium GXU_MW_L88]